ncbi:hypothetical protein JRQ81_015312, partial [Phrynocephalus forsythii]
CLRSNRRNPVDSCLLRAFTVSGLDYSELALPQEFTVWIDPGEVHCRFHENSEYFKVSEELRG